jgi:hypothetical protein
LTQKNKEASQDFGVQRGTIMVIIETEFMDLKKISKTFFGNTFNNSNFGSMK